MSKNEKRSGHNVHGVRRNFGKISVIPKAGDGEGIYKTAATLVTISTIDNRERKDKHL
jgi:hypothetical protein